MLHGASLHGLYSHPYLIRTLYLTKRSGLEIFIGARVLPATICLGGESHSVLKYWGASVMKNRTLQKLVGSAY